jgi:hypothetical protein
MEVIRMFYPLVRSLVIVGTPMTKDLNDLPLATCRKYVLR